MTYNPIDRDEILKRSAPSGGFYDHYFRRLPDFASKRTTGGAQVSAGSAGTSVDAGTTTDDEAEIITVDRDSAFQQGRGFVRDFTIYNISSNPFTDDYQLGLLDNNDVTDDQGCAYVDLKNEEVNVDGTTKAVSAGFKLYDGYRITIEVDNELNETRFIFEGGIDETITVNDIPGSWGKTVALAKSNGGGDEVLFLTQLDALL